MLLAYSPDDPKKDDPGKRVRAEHEGQLGYCPMCKGQVKAVLLNQVWQWKHVRRCALVSREGRK